MEAAEIGTALLLDAGLAEIEEMLSSSSKTKASFSAGVAKKNREPPLITYAMFCFHHEEGPVKIGNVIPRLLLDLPRRQLIANIRR